MTWNMQLFLLLNASVQPGGAAWALAQGLASLPVVLAPLLLVGLWVWGRTERRPALLAVAASLFVGQAVNVLLGTVWYEPRPFMAGIGHTWIPHVADNSFPSDHATVAWSLGLGLVLTRAAPWWGGVACLAGVAAGLARVYLGVHFPVDILVAAPVGLLAAWTAQLMQPAVRRWVAPPLEGIYDAVLARLPAWMPLPRRAAD